MKVHVLLSLTLAVALWRVSLSAQTWHLTTAPSNDWASVACSADGRTLFACAGPGGDGLIYVSTNAGVDWTASSAPIRRWSSVACSADGSRIVAAFPRGAELGGVWRSVNTGQSWTPTGASTTNFWCFVACSADGSRLIACDPNWYRYPAWLYVSADEGAEWWGTPFSQDEHWTSAACSADGKYQVAVSAYFSRFYVSSDYGHSWELAGAPGAQWTSVATSADGTRLVAASTGAIYISTNTGAAWLPSGAPPLQWVAVASSADGARLAAAATAERIYTSGDSGVSWSPSASPATNWQAIGSSADGCRLAGAVKGGGIYVSETTAPPALKVSAPGEGVTLCWITPSSRFILQGSGSVAPTDWTDVLAQPVLNYTNLNQEVSLPAPSGRMFYRLVSR